MPSVYPGALPPVGSASSTDTLAAAGHTSLHNTDRDGILAIATKVGTGTSTPAANQVLRGTGAGTSGWGQVALASEVSGTLPVASGGTGTTTSTGTGSVVLSSSPTIVTPTIASFTNAQHDHTNAAGGGQLDTGALLANAVTKGSQVITANGTNPAQTISAAAGFVNITNATGSFTSQDGGDLLVIATFGAYKSSNGQTSFHRLQIGSTNVPNATGWSFFWNTLLEHQSHTWTAIVTGIAAGTYTVNMQADTSTDSLNFDDADQFTCTILELKK